MIAIPAVDLHAGLCVQLVGGASEQMGPGDPLGVARSWAGHGFRRLHVVDLDAATRRTAHTTWESNEEIVRDILREQTMDIQVGGGVRSGETIERLLSDGACRVVVGSRALVEMDWLAEMTRLFPNELIVTADVQNRRVVSRGWSRTLPRDVLDAVSELNGLALGGLLVTAMHKEGQLGGTDLALMEDVVELSNAPVIASGGITTMDDLRALADRGVSASVIGSALYTGALDPRIVAEEFAD